MFEDARTVDVDVGEGVSIHARILGAGPPLLLLHGYPQTHILWHKIAPTLAKEYTVVAADLRGYGDSSKPPGVDGHLNYSKRVMAQDMVTLMKKLGFNQFPVVDHDRGGRVAHRMARDHPDVVTHLAVLDIVPTLTLFERTDKAFAVGYYHWFFLAQPAPLPERMIGADPIFYLEGKLNKWSAEGAKFDDAALSEYRRCFSDPASIHGSCEDYRAAASIDLEHDAADIDQKVSCPTIVLWGEAGLMHKTYDVLQTWKEVCENAIGQAVPGGHFLPEEAPDETVLAIQSFLSAK